MKNLATAFRSIIRRDRNHPSIIIWNCCVNHQGGNDKLVNAPTGKTVMPTNLKQVQVNLPPDDFGWFVIPAGENAEPGQLVESKPMLVSGQRQTSKLTVQGCVYRIYSSAWSSAPTEVIRGDALFSRMKANPAVGQTAAAAEVTIQGVKRTFTVKTK